MLTLQIEDGVTTVAMSPDGRLVAAGSLDKSVRIWDTNTGVLVERTEGEQGHKDSVYSVAFAPNGQHLVSGSLDKTIRMWKLNSTQGFGAMQAGPHPKNGDCVRTFEGHKDFVLSVALTPDGQWVMSGSKDRGVQFWDPETGHAQLMLQGHKNSGKYCTRLASCGVEMLTRDDSYLGRAVADGHALRHRLGRHEGADLAVHGVQRAVNCFLFLSPFYTTAVSLYWQMANRVNIWQRHFVREKPPPEQRTHWCRESRRWESVIDTPAGTPRCMACHAGTLSISERRDGDGGAVGPINTGYIGP